MSSPGLVAVYFASRRVTRCPTAAARIPETDRRALAARFAEREAARDGRKVIRAAVHALIGCVRR